MIDVKQVNMEYQEQIVRLKWKCTTDIRKLFIRDKKRFIRIYFNFQNEIEKARKSSKLGLFSSIIFVAFYVIQIFAGSTEAQLNLSMWMTVLFLLIWIDGTNKKNHLEMLRLLEDLNKNENVD